MIDNYANGKNSVLMFLVNFGKVSVDMALYMINSSDFQNILNEKFDLIIIGVISQNFLLGYGDHFNCPTAVLTVQKHTSVTNVPAGNPYEINAVNYAFASAGNHTLAYIDYQDKTVYEKIFPRTRYRSYEESMSNVSLVLVNDHFSEGSVRPNVPAVVEIRGIQVKSTPDKLPNDIQKFLDNANEGAIFFSLGTNVKTEQLPNNTIDILMKVFGKLKQKVVMKWNDETMKEKSANVMLKKWLPQVDILAHKNTKLFISHCGLGSIVETKYHGIPILGLPVFGEQKRNCNDIKNQGWSLQLDLIKATENEFIEAINEMLYNETYSTIIKKLSQLNRDRPMTPRKTAIY